MKFLSKKISKRNPPKVFGFQSLERWKHNAIFIWNLDRNSLLISSWHKKAGEGFLSFLSAVRPWNQTKIAGNATKRSFSQYGALNARKSKWTWNISALRKCKSKSWAQSETDFGRFWSTQKSFHIFFLNPFNSHSIQKQHLAMANGG